MVKRCNNSYKTDIHDQSTLGSVAISFEHTFKSFGNTNS